MNKKPRFSIVVPIYNVEKFLHQCIESVLKQSFHDYELILVDDGAGNLAASGKTIEEVSNEILDNFAAISNDEIDALFA